MHLADPPPALTQTLLAAARAEKHADARGAVEPPGQGLWSRFLDWMRPIAGHPAFAGAAVLVLVAGTALALWQRDAGKATEPEVAREHAAYEDRAPQSTENVDRARAPVDEVVTGEATPPMAPGGDVADDRAVGDPAAVAVLPETDADKQTMPVRKSGGSKGATRRDSTLLEVQTEKPDAVTIKEEAEGGEDDAESANLDRKATTTATSGMQQPATEPMAIDPAIEEWAKNAHKRLAKLVADGKCPEAGRLGAEIKDRAPEYYASNVANDRAIRACKSYIEGQAKKKADKNYKSRSQANTVDDMDDAAEASH
jgi:hypothetical protein